MALVLLKPEFSVTKLLTFFIVSNKLVEYKATRFVFTNYCGKIKNKKKVYTSNFTIYISKFYSFTLVSTLF